MRKYPGQISTFPAHNPAYQRRLIVITSGYRLKATYEWIIYGNWLQNYATVAIQDHPHHGFSLQDEADALAAYIEQFDPSELYVVSGCMSVHVTRRLIPHLRDNGLAKQLNGILVVCGYNDPHCFIGVPPAVLKRVTWLITAKWFNRLATWRALRHRPLLPATGEAHPGLALWQTYDDTLPWRTKLAQARAGVRVAPMCTGEWGDIPVAQIAITGDRIIHARVAAEGIAVCNPHIRTVWMQAGEASHCSLPKHPLAWATAIAEACAHLGLMLEPAEFDPQLSLFPS